MKQVITLDKDDIRCRPVGRNLSMTDIETAPIEIILSRKAAEELRADIDGWLAATEPDERIV